MTIKRIALVVAIALLLNGCIFRDRSEVYQRAGSIDSIEVPEGLVAAPMEPLYPIPNVQRQTDAFYDIETDGFVIPRPEPMSAERETSKIKIQKVGERRWVLAEAATGQVWPLAQSYLSSIGVDVESSAPATGLIQTDWVVFKASPQTQSRYRVRIEKGVSPETTEIHVVQQESAVGSQSDKEWPSESDNPESEAWLLDGLANSLAGNIDNKAASLLGQSVGGDVKAELFMDNDEPALRLRLSRGRAWATLAHALGKEGFKQWDESADQGVFYVQYSDPPQERGWFKRLFTFEPDPAAETTPYSLEQVLQHLSSSPGVKAHFDHLDNVGYGKALDHDGGYLVVMKARDGGFVVTVRSPSGERLGLAQQKRLLSVIRRNLI